MNILTKHKNLLPVAVLTISCGTVLLSAASGKVVMAGDEYAFHMNVKHYGAFILVAANFLTYFRFRVFYKWLLLATIIAGAFNLVNFSTLETTWFAGIAGIGIGIQPVALAAGLGALLVGYRQLGTMILGAAINELAIADGIHASVNDEEIANFKERYQHYSTRELSRIVSEEQYVPAALEAARQVLDERAL